MNRRTFITACAAAPFAGRAASALKAAEGDFAVRRTEAEWRARLTDSEYAILREGGTERAFSSPLNDEDRAGTFLCRGCDQPLYRAVDKYDSRTGWPSFTRAIDGAVGTRPDRSWFGTRTEVHCSRCGSHLGHVFDDGPPPTGQRHCINGVALAFAPKTA